MMECNVTPGRRRAPIKKWIRAAILLYLLYAFCTGVLPFLRPQAVSEAFAASVSPEDFYGTSPCQDRAALVETPAEGFDTRIHILDEAKSRIDLSYYAMHMGQTTDLFLGALLDAADRGVQIRILVDGQFGGLTPVNRAYAAAIGAHPNIALKVYNMPNPLKPWTWNGRLHDKYIIVDDRLLLMGGRNIGDKYFGPENYEKPLSYDRDVLIYNTAWEAGSGGSVLSHVRGYMDSLWDGPNVRQLFTKDTKSAMAKRQALQAEFGDFRSRRPDLFDHTGDDYESATCTTNRVTFFHNDTNIGIKSPKTGYILGRLLTNAESFVALQSPYVILDSALEQLLRDLGEMDIEAAILTNSAASSPNPAACAAYLGDRKTILGTGVRLWEYQSEDSIHGKTYLIDDRMAVVGSYNLDPRSAYIDTEMLLAIDSTDFTRQLKKAQEAYWQQALEVGPEGRYFQKDTLRPRPLPLLKKIMLLAIYVPVRLFKQLT